MVLRISSIFALIFFGIALTACDRGEDTEVVEDPLAAEAPAAEETAEAPAEEPAAEPAAEAPAAPAAAAPAGDAPDASMEALAGSWSFDAESTLAGFPEEERQMFEMMFADMEQTMTFGDSSVDIVAVMGGETQEQSVPIEQVSAEGNVIVLRSTEESPEQPMEDITITFHDAETIHLTADAGSPPMIFKRS